LPASEHGVAWVVAGDGAVSPVALVNDIHVSEASVGWRHESWRWRGVIWQRVFASQAIFW